MTLFVLQQFSQFKCCTMTYRFFLSIFILICHFVTKRNFWFLDTEQEIQINVITRFVTVSFDSLNWMNWIWFWPWKALWSLYSKLLQTSSWRRIMLADRKALAHDVRRLKPGPVTRHFSFILFFKCGFHPPHLFPCPLKATSPPVSVMCVDTGLPWHCLLV